MWVWRERGQSPKRSLFSIKGIRLPAPGSRPPPLLNLVPTPFDTLAGPPWQLRSPTRPCMQNGLSVGNFSTSSPIGSVWHLLGTQNVCGMNQLASEGQDHGENMGEFVPRSLPVWGWGVNGGTTSISTASTCPTHPAGTLSPGFSGSTTSSVL